MSYTYSTQKVTGITKEIKFQVEFRDGENFTAGQLYYKIDTVEPTYDSNVGPAVYSFTPVNHLDSITLLNDQYLTFSVVGTGTLGSTTVTIINLSDELRKVASFLVDIQNTPGGGLTPSPPIDFINDSTSNGQAETNLETILGLSQAIDIEVYWSTTGGPAFYELYAVKNGSLILLSMPGDVVTVANDDTLRFILLNPDPTSITLNVELINVTDNYSSLDLFSLTTYSNL